MNVLRILIRIRMERGRPRGRKKRDIRRLMELAKLLWDDFRGRYNIRWREGEISEM